jgi:hypothetical protein
VRGGFREADALAKLFAGEPGILGEQIENLPINLADVQSSCILPGKRTSIC